VQFWDLATGKTRDLPAHPGRVYFVRLTPDAKQVLAVGTGKGILDHRYRLSETATGKVLFTGTIPIECWEPFGFSPDGKTVAWPGQSVATIVGHSGMGRCSPGSAEHQRAHGKRGLP
jgi:hypothetical protein